MAPARDPVEAVARVADSRRERLLRIHRRRLRWEDLEDCYSQATLELVARAQRDPFASSEHIKNALEQKFSSRIDDRRRAIGGRSPIEAAIATALAVDVPDDGAGELEDPDGRGGAPGRRSDRGPPAARGRRRAQPTTSAWSSPARSVSGWIARSSAGGSAGRMRSSARWRSGLGAGSGRWSPNTRSASGALASSPI